MPCASQTTPTDWPIYWFAVLEKAVEKGDHQIAAQAQRELARLGVRVSYGRRPTPRSEEVRALSNANHKGFSVADLCGRWRVGPDKIHGFIRRGELAAVNVATNLSARPQWRITPESVDLFEQRRKQHSGADSPSPTPTTRGGGLLPVKQL